MVCCGVHRDAHGRENYVLFGFTLICFVAVSFSILIFVINFACLCPRRFPYQIMCPSSSRNTTGFTSEAGTVDPSLASKFTPVHSFLCSVL